MGEAVVVVIPHVQQRVLNASALVLAVATLVLYLVLIRQQGSGGPAWWYVALVAAGAVGCGVALASKLWPVGAAGALLLAITGFLGIFSVGLPLLIASALAGAAAIVAGADYARRAG